MLIGNGPGGVLEPNSGRNWSGNPPGLSPEWGSPDRCPLSGRKAEIRDLKAQIESIEVDQLIPVTACWSMARHRPFSRGSVSMKISVRDIRDLLVEAGASSPASRLFEIHRSAMEEMNDSVPLHIRRRSPWNRGQPLAMDVTLSLSQRYIGVSARLEDRPRRNRPSWRRDQRYLIACLGDGRTLSST